MTIAIPLAPSLLGHGIGAVKDLPIPAWLFFYGAAIVLVVSFAALGALWRRPLLERRAEGKPLPERAQRILLHPALRAVLGGASFALLVLVWVAAALGRDEASANLAPTFVYVVFWLGLVPFVVLFGNVWRVLNPWLAAADGASWAWRRLGLPPRTPLPYPDRLGRWPAAVLLLAWAALELAWIDPANPRHLATAIAIYSWLAWFGMYVFGRRPWLENGEAFHVYFEFLSRISPFARQEGRIVVRTPLSGLARVERRPGTIAFVSVMLGSVAFDGFSRTSWYQDRYYSVQSELFDYPDLADAMGMLVGLAGLIAFVAAVACVFVVVVWAVRWSQRDERRLVPAFVGSLVPIALAYAVAHYFSLLVLQGQFAVRLASDPLGRGWDLLGTSDFQPNLLLLSTNLVWYVQVAALVVGHVLGLTLAHDRAVSLYGSGRAALSSQLPMLALMVTYTVGGMWLLSRG